LQVPQVRIYAEVSPIRPSHLLASLVPEASVVP